MTAFIIFYPLSQAFIIGLSACSSEIRDTGLFINNLSVMLYSLYQFSLTLGLHPGQHGNLLHFIIPLWHFSQCFLSLLSLLIVITFFWNTSYSIMAARLQYHQLSFQTQPICPKTSPNLTVYS